MLEEQNENETVKARKGPVQDPQELLKAVVESKPGGQMRAQQVEAVDAISESLTKKENLILEAPTGSGKALAVNTPILTGDGWKTMGEVTEADRIYGTDGNLINIIEAHEAYTPEELFILTLENDEQIVADGPHLWPVHYPVGTEQDLNEIVEQVKADLESATALPDTISASSLMYMLPYVPEEIQKHFKKNYEKDHQYASVSLLEEFYLFLRNTAGREILTTEELYERFLEAESKNANNENGGNRSVNVLSFTGTLQWGIEDLSSMKQAKIVRKLLKPKYDGRYDLQNISPTSKKDLLKALLIEAGETNPNGTGYYYLDIPSQTASEDLKQMISSLGYKTVTLSPSGRLLFQSEENLLEGTRNSDQWMKPYDTFYTNDFMKVESIVRIKNTEEVKVRCLTVDSPNHLFLVGKHFIPTHNTLSYLVPAVFHETKAVISTATKQLSEQIVNIDIPFVQEIVKEHSPAHQFSAALLKGRENYYCLAKEAEQKRFDDDAENSLFGVEEVSESAGSAKGKQIASESKKILDWSKKTKTGDRTEAPAVSDEVWRMFSSSSAECPGRGVCSFASQCFSEKAREKAKEADIVVTNHAVVANDLRAEEAVLLGDRDTYIFDELHELDHYLSDAWGVSLTAKTLKDTVRKFGTIKGVKDDTVEEYEKLGKKFNALADMFEPGLIETAPKIFDSYMSQLYKITNLIAERANQQATDKENNESKKKQGSQVFKQASEIANAALMLMNDNKEDIVRWVAETENKKTGETSRTFHATLLRVGPELQQSLAQRDANMVGTSATIRVAGSFEIPVHNLDLKNAGVPYKTKELSSPFNYKKQAMIYVPDPSKFPAPDWKTRDKHSEAVRNEALELITAMGGRALMLHTTTYEMNRMGEFLKAKLKNKYKVLVQGDAPNQQLIDEFKEDKTSVLVATMGMWHGLDVPGDALALVMMDKIPFTPMNDPLSKARQNWADNNGRSGFNDVYVAEANIMLAQGAGRLIRSVNDKGIIAIFDTRLRTKGYARNMTKSLPNAGYFMDKSTVTSSAERLGKTFTS